MKKYERCLWILNTIVDCKQMSLEELQNLWMRSSLNDDRIPLNARTFARDKDFIAETFKIDIIYNKVSNKYMLEDTSVMNEGKLYRYLLDCVQIHQMSDLSIRMRQRIMIDTADAGMQWLRPILEAIDHGVTIGFDYLSFYRKSKPYHFEVIPCFVRLFEHRWYVICEYLDHSASRVLAMDRISGLRQGSKKLQPSKKMIPEKFYEDCFGINHEEIQPEYILIKAFGPQVDYIRSLPIHPSQEEVISNEEYTVFSYFLRPSFDFIQELLWQRDIEVVQPDFLRKRMKEELSRLLSRHECIKS